MRNTNFYIFFLCFLTTQFAKAQGISISATTTPHKVLFREFIDTLITKDTENNIEEIMIVKTSGMYLKLSDCANLKGILELGSSTADLAILRTASNLNIYCVPAQSGMEWNIKSFQATIESNNQNPKYFEETNMSFSLEFQDALMNLNSGDKLIVKNLQLMNNQGKMLTIGFEVVGGSE
ncbi:MAG: hypothetical protein IPM34_14305 [Saprospiraceae bacterium]|nr:hypothetical protein [Saprospiraceae bacterium]